MNVSGDKPANSPLSPPKTNAESALLSRVPTKTTDFGLLENWLVKSVSCRDLFRLTRQLNDFRRQVTSNKDLSKDWPKWSSAVQRSLDTVATRRASLPPINFPDLPVSNRSEEILELILNNQVVVIAGETGSGKTTQIPKICLQAGRGIRGLIGHTQPRRLAARTVASRIAEEFKTP